MASKIDIVNIGLVAIGETPITSLSGQQLRQVTANALYDHNRRALLTEQNWRFATHTQILARQSVTPVDDRYTYQYSLPTDPKLLAVRRVKPGGKYEIQGDALLSNNATLRMTYVADVSEEVMPAYFVQLLGLLMGVRMAIPLTKKVSRYDTAKDQFDDYLPKAKYADASQQPPEEHHSQPFIDVRQ